MREHKTNRILQKIEKIALGFFMSLTEIFTPYFRLSIPVALERSFKALLAALTLGFLEEFFFRGLIFKGKSYPLLRSASSNSGLISFRIRSATN